MNQDFLWKAREQRRSLEKMETSRGKELYVKVYKIPELCTRIVFHCLFFVFLGLHLQHMEVPRLKG